MPEQVSSEWIVHALTRGRTAERIEAQRLLEDAEVALDRAEVRRRLLDVLHCRLAPDRSTDPAGSDAFARGWVLGALGRVPSSAGEPEQTLFKYIDRQYEASCWNRYWALEALMPHRLRGAADADPLQPSPKLFEACRKIAADDDEHPLPRRLAVAILAGAGSQAERNGLAEIASILRKDPADAAGQSDLWATLRALRFVYLPTVIDDLIRVVEREENGKPIYDDFTYDALVVLGNVQPDSRFAEHASLALIKFIHRVRDFQFWDAFRMRAIESLGRLRHAHARPLLVEELADYNPAVAREAALALESILGARSAAAVVLEEAAKANGADRGRLARGLREMCDRAAIIDALGTAMTSRDSTAQRNAQALLSEVGGVGAFDKLRSLTKSTEDYLEAMKEADEQLRKLFERTMLGARVGIAIAVGMDVVMFIVGLVLIAIAVALTEQNRFGALTALITGAGGIVSVVVGRFYAKPRERVQDSVHYLTGVKAIFLGYLRQLRQTDQAYTRRVLEGTPLSTEETGKFNDIVDATMTKALAHLAKKPEAVREEEPAAAARVRTAPDPAAPAAKAPAAPDPPATRPAEKVPAAAASGASPAAAK